MSGTHKALADQAYTMASEVIRTCISRFHGLWSALPLVYLANCLLPSKVMQSTVRFCASAKQDDVEHFPPAQLALDERILTRSDV